MKKVPESKIALTLYNLRDFCQTESDLDSSLAKIRGFGYEVVQVSGLSLDAKIIKKYLDKNGLFCCATHEGYDAFAGDINKMADKLDILECDFTALGAPPEKLQTPEGMKELAEIFNRQAEILKSRNIRIGYHNHDFEFARVGSEKILLDHFYDNTTDLVCAELDVHWITRGGGNPEAWIRRFKNRIPVIHFKDFTILDRKPVFCEIGEGNLDWKGIIKACDDSGVRFYSIEQDAQFKDRCIFESMKISFDNLRKMGVK